MSLISKVISQEITPVFTLITAGLAAYLSFWVEPQQEVRNHKLQESIASVDSIVKKSEQSLKELKHRRDLEWKVYEEVVRSLQESEKHQKAAKSLVVVMVEDAILRDSLLALFEQSESKVIAQEARIIRATEKQFLKQTETIATRDLVNRTKATSEHDWGEWDFDILWCKSNHQNNQEIAGAIKEAIKSKTKTKGFVRVREIPGSKVSSHSFSHFGYKIYWDKGEEKEKNMLEAIVSEALGDKRAKLLKVEPNSGEPSDWYLSVFVCPIGGDR